jgi:hypothetical protein
MELNKWEKQVVELAKANSRISLSQISMIYKSPEARVDAIRRLVQMGYLMQDHRSVAGSFVWSGKDCEEEKVSDYILKKVVSVEDYTRVYGRKPKSQWEMDEFGRKVEQEIDDQMDLAKLMKVVKDG